MLYIGLDVHSKWMTIAGLDPATGERLRWDQVANDCASVVELFGKLKGPLHGVMESGTNSWAMYRELLPFFERLVVADPVSLWDRRRDRKAKTDRLDAMRLAQMLSRDEIKPLYIPDERTQDLRILVRGKVRISRWAPRLTNEIGSMLRSWGYVGSRSLLTKSGKREMDQAELPKHSARVLELWRELLETAQKIEDELSAAIEEEAASDNDCALLRTVPGVGAFTALLIKAEIGNVERFESSSQLISYVGLSPRVYQSGENCRYGQLGTWGNRWLRYAIGLLAQRVAHSTKNGALKTTYWRVQFRNHKNAAKMAVARKFTRAVHQMLTHGEAWDEAKARSREASAA